MVLRLSRAELDKVYAQARDEHPAECCGLLTVGPDGGASSAHPCTNIQDRLHAEDPVEYPREARIAYFIDPVELLTIITTAERDGGAVSGFYHSHIDCDAYFSAEDKERALTWDEPAYPDAIHLVVSVYEEGVKGHKAFAWNAASADFEEVHIDVDDQG